MPEFKRFSLVKPTLQTRFRIDFQWWEQNDRDWRVHLASLLCPQHEELYANAAGNQMVDWIDLQTAEVQRVDAVQHVLITHCAKQPEFITPHTAMVDAIFRVYLVNGNAPLTPVELGAQLSRPPEIILRTLSGAHNYRGVRPCLG